MRHQLQRDYKFLGCTPEMFRTIALVKITRKIAENDTKTFLGI